MKKKKMLIKDLRPSKINEFFDILLIEEDGEKALNIAIGEYEAKNIAVCLDSISIPRPLSYDSFYSILQRFNINVKEVTLTKFRDGTYYANLICNKNDDDNVECFDIRPSDAINIALRSHCPIYASEDILNDVGFDYKKYFNDMIKDTTNDKEKSCLSSIEDMSIWGLNMLEDLLSDAIQREDYQVASILRDKIKELKNKEDKQ
jgi:bifunctional DNase/RNase